MHVAPRLWIPRRVLVTPSAFAEPHGAMMAERAAVLGAEVVRLSADRLTGLPDRYADAKRTLAIVNAPPSKRRSVPIPPSADWRFDLAEGCPAHCAYCYLAGSLTGPPITRVYANVDAILAGLVAVEGQGQITSRSAARAGEGTTYEASCYTDPLGIEHLTGSLAAAIEHFGARGVPEGGRPGGAKVELRATTKFAAVEPLLGLAHGGRTRLRFSVNAAGAERYEGGTAPVAARLQAMRRVADAGYKVGLVVAPILPLADWRGGYGRLLAEAAGALAGAASLDLTAELITHRFTARSKGVLQGWYPGSGLEMDEALRARKTTRFGTEKWVLPRSLMVEMRGWFERTLADLLPSARLLYWT
jgi:spore photoproduct lyase